MCEGEHEEIYLKMIILHMEKKVPLIFQSSKDYIM